MLGLATCERQPSNADTGAGNEGECHGSSPWHHRNVVRVWQRWSGLSRCVAMARREYPLGQQGTSKQEHLQYPTRGSESVSAIVRHGRLGVVPGTSCLKVFVVRLTGTDRFSYLILLRNPTHPGLRLPRRTSELGRLGAANTTAVGLPSRFRCSTI